MKHGQLFLNFEVVQEKWKKFRWELFETHVCFQQSADGMVKRAYNCISNPIPFRVRKAIQRFIHSKWPGKRILGCSQ